MRNFSFSNLVGKQGIPSFELILYSMKTFMDELIWVAYQMKH